MADREEDAASARAGVEQDRRASLNEEREREREIDEKGEEKRREWMDSSTCLVQ